MAWHNDLGHWGERIAAEYLERKGWYVRHIDWKDRHRDLDVVCIDADMTTLLIVEVKTRTTDVFGDPEESIDIVKQNNILRAAQTYVRLYRYENLDLRYDTITIVGTPDTTYTVTHKENAFDMTSNYVYKENARRRRAFEKQNNVMWKTWT